jgi:2-polyprenyl-3-methyl-5-hydroxy-6-metoxy-1,4-benzoquinol methylase
MQETGLNIKIHEKWEKAYRTTDAEHFTDVAFDFLAGYLKPELDAEILDAGCGNCTHSIRLAERGFQVKAIDFSEKILEHAKAKVKELEFQDKIDIKTGDLLSIPFHDCTFKYILCWGVLMHIPDIKKAIYELSRVLEKNGLIIISEINMHSIQSFILLRIKKLLIKNISDLKITPEGVESWKVLNGQRLLSRETDIDWLINEFNKYGIKLEKRFPGRLTEIYSRFKSKKLIKLIHKFNLFWFKYSKNSKLAASNILIFKKTT